MQSSGVHVEVVSESAIIDYTTDVAASAIHDLEAAFGRARRRVTSIVVLEYVDALGSNATPQLMLEVLIYA